MARKSDKQTTTGEKTDGRAGASLGPAGASAPFAASPPLREAVMVAGRTGGAGNRAKSAHSLRLASCLPDTRVMGVFRRSIRRDAATASRNDNLAPPRNLRMCGSRGGFARKSFVSGKSVLIRLALGGCRIITKPKHNY